LSSTLGQGGCSRGSETRLEWEISPVALGAEGLAPLKG
jgi:hypothetical protein